MGIYCGLDVSNKNYDVVIVGAGIAGSILAKELSEKGYSILILEAGEGTTLDYQGYMNNLKNYYNASIKAPNSPYPQNLNAPQPDEMDVVSNNPLENSKGYFVQKGPLPYRSDYTRILGGTSLHWLGTCLRMLPEDFNIYTNYGIGLDWPLNYQDLSEYYKKAELEIGVSGNVEDQHELSKWILTKEQWFDEDYVFPMHQIPQSYLDQYFINGLKNASIKLAGNEYPIRVTSTPQGRNGMPNDRYKVNGKTYDPVGAVGNHNQGKRCQGFSSCIPICPVQAKYNAMKTLNSALKTKRVDLVTQAVVSNIKINTDGKVEEVIYKAYQNKNSPEHQTYVARGTIFVLAAHAIENAKLMLASSLGGDKVGLYLMDHPTLVTWGLAPKKLGTFRGPGSTSGIETLRVGKIRKYHSAFRVDIGNLGWQWPTGAPGTLISELIYNQKLFGEALKNKAYDLSQRQVRLAFLLDQPADMRNCITISSKYKDRLGNFRPVIHYNLSDYTLAGLEAAKQTSDFIFEHLGIEDHTKFEKDAPGYVTYKGKGYVYSAAGHFIGGHIMGTSKKNSVVNIKQQVWGHENLYMVGCGNMPTSGTANPTLTMAAITFMAAENIENALKNKIVVRNRS
ncbi:choline dehydrogenase [Bacillus thuringiensis]|nr:choline dehydrogenase [Bacillus thuringiensis]